MDRAVVGRVGDRSEGQCPEERSTTWGPWWSARVCNIFASWLFLPGGKWGENKGPLGLSLRTARGSAAGELTATQNLVLRRKEVEKLSIEKGLSCRGRNAHWHLEGIWGIMGGD